MRPPHIPLVGLVALGALAAGSCAGAAIGHFTVTGGLSPGAGWSVPSFGTDEAIAALPEAVSIAREDPAPRFVGYYPAQASDVADPTFADAAAQAFDELYDDPVFEAPVEAEQVPEPEPLTATQAQTYWEPAVLTD